MKYRLSTSNERVWCTTQFAKLSFNHSIGRTHSWRSSTFYKTFVWEIYTLDQWPKSGTFLFQCSPRPQDAIWLANAGRHPTMATPGRPDFGYGTRKRYPIIIPHYPKIAGQFDHIGPTAQHAPSEFHRSSSLCSRRPRERTICLMSMVWFSWSQTTASSLPLSNQKSNLSTALSLLPTKSHLTTAAV